jgi:YjbE family integral membrane protein
MDIGRFLINGLRIVLIDLLLAGDNALVIAMAVRSLPRRERRIGTACGAVLAVVLRVALTAVAARLLTVEYLKLAGGLLVLWIAWKVLGDVSEQPDTVPAPQRLLQAIWYVVFADLTMSTDNILAIAGASGGHFGLIVFGLCLSIPFVVFSSNLLADLMNRFPLTIYLGVAILGQVGADMVLTDPSLAHALHPSNGLRYGIEGAVIAALLIASRLRARRYKQA